MICGHGSWAISATIGKRNGRWGSCGDRGLAADNDDSRRPDSAVVGVDANTNTVADHRF
jgi:hypothetical protein